MEFLNTQIGKVLEQVKMTMLAHIPIVYIPTEQLEIVNELLYSPETIDSLVPRVFYDPTEKKIIHLSPQQIGETNESTSKFTSIIDNYIVGTIDSNTLRVPSIIVSYSSDWTKIYASVKAFISEYLGIKTSKNSPDPNHTDVVKRSLCIVVTPKELTIPEDIVPYVRTIHVPPLTDEEIENIIIHILAESGIPDSIISEQLFGQIIVSLRGFSKIRIEQLFSQIISEQIIDINSVSPAAVLEVIRQSKKQLLSNSHGLKWEKTDISGVAGLDSITQWLSARIEIFNDPENAKRQHIDIPNGVLITGIPGSGKSLMAKTTATLLNMPLISLDMGGLLGGIMGESEHNMINALSMAEQMAPCVLWIDEIEKAFSGSSQNSSSSDGGVGRRMFGKFLTWMQEKSAACFVFATSNDITCLPPELFRSERFDKKYFTFMPMAEECAQIFAANIKSQNEVYTKEFSTLPARKQIVQPQQLFAVSLESAHVWLNILNDCCTTNKEECSLRDYNEGKLDNEGNAIMPLYGWSTNVKPKNKLLTGADISALIREAKFMVHSSPSLKSGINAIYGESQMRNAVRTLLSSPSFKPYGETNLKDIVKCFVKLHENEFVPASGKCIVDFDSYDDDEKMYRHDAKITWENEYDRVLYYTIVGAINHYSKEFSK